MRHLQFKSYEITAAERGKASKLHKITVTGTSRLEAEQIAMAELKKKYPRVVFFKHVKTTEL